MKYEKLETTELIKLETLKPIDIYGTNSREALESIINKIESTVADFEPDITTAVGRKSIASIAHRIAKSKTLLDEMGKQLTEESRNVINLVNADRKIMRERLDTLKNKTREPLTVWENSEKERVDILKERMDELNSILPGLHRECLSNGVRECLGRLNVCYNFGWQEMEEVAAKKYQSTHETLNRILLACEKKEHEAAENKRLREEIERREAVEREKTIALKKAAEEKAALEHKIEAGKRAAEDASKAQKLKLKEAQEYAEKVRIEAIEAKKQAVIDTENAVEAERLRKEKEIEDKRSKELADKEAQEANLKHKTIIHDRILQSIIGSGVEKGLAVCLVAEIINGHIPHININY